MIRLMSEPKKNYPRDLDDEYKQFFRSIAEGYAALSNIVTVVSTDKTIRFKGRLRPKRSQVINAMILYLDSLPVEQQRDAIRSGMARLNALLRLPADPQKSEKPAEREAGEGLPAIKTVAGDPPASSPRKSRGKGRNAG